MGQSFSNEALQLDPPVHALMQLAHTAPPSLREARVTQQTVLSCLINLCGCQLSVASVVAGCWSDVALLLISVLRASEVDASLRSCALAAMYHLSSESSVLSVLARDDSAIELLQVLVENLSGNEAAHAHAAIKRLKFAARRSNVVRPTRQCSKGGQFGKRAHA